jgi:hypothetical protein
MTLAQIRKALLGIACLLVAVFAADVTIGDTGMPASQRQVIETISDYETSGPDIFTPIFKEIRYTPTSSSWRAFPAIRKLQALYASAEVGSRGGGSRAIAAVADKLSKKYDSVRNNPGIQAFVRGQDITTPITFGQEPAGLLQTTPEVHSVIIQLAPIAEGRLGGLYKILKSDFGLEPERAYAILATSDDATSALERGLSEVIPEQERILGLERLINRAKKAYPLLAKERVIVEYEEAQARDRAIHARVRAADAESKILGEPAKGPGRGKGVPEEPGFRAREIPGRAIGAR